MTSEDVETSYFCVNFYFKNFKKIVINSYDDYYYYYFEIRFYVLDILLILTSNFYKECCSLTFIFTVTVNLFVSVCVLTFSCLFPLYGGFALKLKKAHC